MPASSPSSGPQVGRIEHLHARLDDLARKLGVLENENEQMRLVLHGTADGFWDWPDLSVNRQWWSPRYFEMLGYEANAFEPTLDWFAEHLHPDDRTEAMAGIDPLLGQTRPFVCRFRIRHRSGEYRWFESRGQVYRDGSGRPVRLAGSVRDVTELRAANEALQQANARLAEAEHIADLGHWEWDITHDAVTRSEGLYRIFGETPQSMNGGFGAFLDRVHADDRDEVENAVHEALEGRTPFDVQYRYLRPDGSTRHLHSRAVVLFDDAGRPVRLLGVVQDITTSKKTEEVRDAILELSQDLICIASVDGYFKYVNPAWERTLGYSRDELLSRPFMDFIHPDDHEKNDAEVESLKRGNLTIDFENRYVGKDGRVRTISWTATPMTRDGLLYCVGRDITERKRTEDALRENEELLHAALESTADGILVVDEHGHTTHTNARFAEMWRIPDHLLKTHEDRHLLQFVLDQLVSPEAFLARVSDVYASSERSLDTLAFKDGRCFERYSCPLILKGKNAGRVWSFRDITARVRAESASQERQEAQRRLQERLRELVLVSNELTLADTVDDLCRRTIELGRARLGFDRLGVWLTAPGTDGLTGMYGTDERGRLRDERGVLRPLSQEEKAALAEGFAGVRGVENPTGLQDDRGNVVGEGMRAMAGIWDGKELRGFMYADNQLTGQSLTDQDCEVLGLYASSLGHLLSRKRAEAEKLDLEERLRQSEKLQAVGQLAGGVAHDFNNMLAAIMGNAEALAKTLNMHDSADAHRADYVEQIIEASERAADLTRQLLTFGRKRKPHLEYVDLNDVVEASLKMIRRVVDERITIQTDLSAGLHGIRADAHQMHQVMLNLAINARDAMPDGGTLTIEARNVVLDEASRAARIGSTAGPHVRLTVRDTGFGMDDETRQRMFEPYFTTKPVGKGSGMGLALVYGIVEEIGGRIDVDSEPGRGTSISLLIPAFEGEREKEAEPRRVAEPPHRPATILLCEDQRLVLDATRRSLEACGYRVLCAESGRQAQQIFDAENGPIHALITDVVMPEMTGPELADSLRRRCPELKVIYTSGYEADALDLVDIKRDGTRFIEKPCWPHDLLSLLSELLADHPSSHDK